MVLHMIRTRLLFWLDVLLLLALAVLEEPRFTSLGGHEWLGIAFTAFIAIHLILNWRWIVATVARLQRVESRRTRISAALNGALFLIMVITVFSGMESSEVVLPLSGLAPSELAAWQRIHNFLSQVTMAVVGLHIALNWDWITSVVRKGSLRRSRRPTTP
jgi:hypothetical protein